MPASYRLAGQRLDEGVGAPTGELALGLTFYNSRYYDPTLASFTQHQRRLKSGLGACVRPSTCVDARAPARA